MVGNSIVAMEFVIADGNKMQGSAIPVKIPYVLNEVEVESPDKIKQFGMETASILCSTFNKTRLAVSGTERERSSFVNDKYFPGRQKLCDRAACCRDKVNTQ